MATGSPPGNREEQFLEKFFPLISHFAYDKAKDLIDKEKESVKTAGGVVFGSSSSVFGSSSGLFGSTWGLLVYCLVQFVTAEKAYTSLGFLEPKGILFHRQKDLKALNQNLITELKKVEDSTDQVLGHLSGHLCHYLTARLKTMEFYVQLSTSGTNKAMTYNDLVNVITDIVQNSSKFFHHPLLSPLKAAFGFECDTILNLLQAQIYMSDWKFLPSLMQLYEAHTKLTTWGATAQLKETKKSTFGSSSKHSGWPALYLWLTKYKGFLLSKFSVYFYDVLQKQTTQGEMKSLIAKAPEDFIAKLTNFHRKCDAFYVALVLDVHGLGDTYKGPGYTLPNKTQQRPQGLDSYPTIFSYPHTERPANHWPSVVSLITNRSHENKVVCVQDKRANSTYFLSQVDERVTLVVIFETKKSEKDSYVNNFMVEVSSNLRGLKLFSTLKPGIKG